MESGSEYRMLATVSSDAALILCAELRRAGIVHLTDPIELRTPDGRGTGLHWAKVFVPSRDQHRASAIFERLPQMVRDLLPSRD